MSSPNVENETDPDLTAMLDMVMQMLMFFIICAQVIKSEKNEDVKLPRSDEAHLITAVDKESYFINLIPYRTEDVAKRLPSNTDEEKREKERKLKIIQDMFRENDP